MQLPRKQQLRVLATLSCTLLLALILIPSATAVQDSGSTGLHDEAGVLNAGERDEIEQAIGRVERAGAPTVVYLRSLDSGEDRAVRDAQQLMEDWEIESEPNALDGLVLFFNLEPDDPNRGEFGIVAGEEHIDGGALPQSELNRIRDEMIEYLADDRLAEAIVHGLDRAAERLDEGPPEPGAFETFLERIATGPLSLLNVIGVSLAALVGIYGWRVWRDRPRADHLYQGESTSPPEELHPTLAGALVDGAVQHHHIEAMLIKLAEFGAVRIEADPKDDERARIQILDRDQVASPAEEALMQGLVDEAEDDVLDQKALQSVQGNWSDVQDLVRIEMEELGWFDRDASSRQVPLIVGGALAFVLGLLAILPAIVLEETWALIAGSTLMAVGVLKFAFGMSYPRTSYEGERKAVPWRGYREGLRRAARQDYGAIDLDEAFPFIVAFGLVQQYHDQLEQSSEHGYIPRWLRATADSSELPANTWFVYWLAFHSSVNYSASASSGSVPGGAATGSGGAGGRF